MTTVIVLGNRLNDDKSFTKAMYERMNLTLKAIKKFNADYIILSGGIANEKAGISEAEAMKNYLVRQGIDENMLILEDQSHTTLENAKFSIPIAKKIKSTTIIVVSSIEHFARQAYNVYSYFDNLLQDEKIELIFYTQTAFN